MLLKIVNCTFLFFAFSQTRLDLIFKCHIVGSVTASSLLLDVIVGYILLADYDLVGIIFI